MNRAQYINLLNLAIGNKAFRIPLGELRAHELPAPVSSTLYEVFPDFDEDEFNQVDRLKHIIVFQKLLLEREEPVEAQPSLGGKVDGMLKRIQQLAPSQSEESSDLTVWVEQVAPAPSRTPWVLIGAGVGTALATGILGFIVVKMFFTPTPPTAPVPFSEKVQAHQEEETITPTPKGRVSRSLPGKGGQKRNQNLAD